MKENGLLTKSYAFAIRIVRLSQHLDAKHHQYVLSKQVLKSGTSIGANAEEMVGASSEKDFLAKAAIAYREARETHYSIRLLRDTDYIDAQAADSLLTDCEELLKILGAIQKTMKNKYPNPSAS